MPETGKNPAPHAAAPAPLRFPDRAALSLDQPRLMGVLNVTPDSFSDGGRFFDGTDAGLDAAVAQALAMAEQGAALLDVGGESTRPGAQRVEADTQIARVVPVIERVRAALDARFPDVVISVDTTLAAVAEAALDAGAAMLNDVSAGREDGGMFSLAADRGVPVALMHMQGQPGTMQKAPQYGDVAAEVLDFLKQRADAAQQAGVPRGQVVIDPGIGFGKTLEHNLALLAALPRFVTTGYPVLLGASRKSFLAKLDPKATDPVDRVPGTIAVTALAVATGVPLLRVHDVAPNAQAAAVAAAVIRHTAHA